MKPPGSTVQPSLVGPERPSGFVQFLLMVSLLMVAILPLFWKALFCADYAVFSNDGPLGHLTAQWAADLPGNIFSVWQDLNWLGGAEPSGIINISIILNTVLGAVMFAKLYAPFAILLVGLSAWFFFWRWEFSPAVCLLGGLAAALNSDFLSTACWGVASQPISFGVAFLALAALADESSPRRWVRVALAGMAVGMVVNDSFDIGALFSLFVAAFVLFQALNAEGARARNLAVGLGRLALLAVCAVVVAAGALFSLVNTQVKGVVGMGQDAASKAQRWNDATLFSIPKKETLGVLVPGLFGFRMDTPGGGAYWGAVAQDPAYDSYFEAKRAGQEVTRPDANPRFTGGGCYAGVLVVLVALWAAAQSFRKTEGVFSARDRRFIWFWLGGALMTLLMAYGRFAPFYKIFYALPFASVIRSPAKFIHLFTWALIILFGYGLQGLSRLCLEGTATEEPPGLPSQPGAWWATLISRTRGFWLRLGSHWRAWWATAGAWDRNWVRASVVALVVSLAALVLYATKHHALVTYLQDVHFDAATSNSIAEFSLRQVAWFIGLLILALCLIAVLLGGVFKGRAGWGAAFVGCFLAVDLLVANQPWAIIYNWKEVYESNPILDLLREKPFEHRVSLLRGMEQFLDLRNLPTNALPLVQNYFTMEQLYDGEWAQHLFPYYDIQSLDVIMLPRVPVEYNNYETALRGVTLRHWELTNTRYLLGLATPADQFNQLVDPARRSFKILQHFAVVPKPNVTGPPVFQMTAVSTPDGPCALYEFSAALPRAKLYSNWQLSTNDQETLKQLASPAFDPAQKVLVAARLPAPLAADANKPAGTVDVTSYAPKQIRLQAKATAPSVLLLNDRFDLGWKVTVDGKPAELLRCNYIMRGVQVPPGEHQIEFRFGAPRAALCVSFVGIVAGVGLLVFLGFSRRT